MRYSIYVARLLVSWRTADKITNRHGIALVDLRDEVECVEGLQGVRDDRSDGSTRYYLFVKINRRNVKVVLCPHPADVDVYYLASAYHV